MKIVHNVQGWIGIFMICFALWIAFGAILQMPGCEGSGPQDTTMAQAAYDESLLLITAAAEEAAKLRDKPNKTPEESAALAKAEATISTLQAALAAAVDAEGKVDPVSGVMALTTFIPPPYNVPSSIILGMFGTWLKGRKTRTAFKKLVEGINHVKMKNGSFASSLDAVGSQLKDAMGPQATKVVDKARKEGKFPVV